MSQCPSEKELEAMKLANRKLELLAERAELRGRICQAIKDLDWISREEAAAYLNFSLATLGRYLVDNAQWIRTRHNGSGKNGRLSIYREDIERLQLKTATGGEEIPDEERWT